MMFLIFNGLLDCFAFRIFSLTLSCYEERVGKMVNGYCEVYHDRSYIDIHFWRVLAKKVIYAGGIDRCLYFGLGIVPLTGQGQR